MKKYLRDIVAMPSKRIYLSIISDYHLDLALCELIDNAIDNWIFNCKTKQLYISITLDFDRQLIFISDNSGGIEEDDVQLIVSPGYTKRNHTDEVIGIFGVGSKRAVIALAEEIKIYTRYKNGKTILIELNDEWIKDENDWTLKTYEVNDIAESTTTIELTKLRDKLNIEQEQELIDRLGAIYALFLEDNIKILLNEKEVIPQTFDDWSYPEGFEPKKVSGPVNFGVNGSINVEITGGLTKSHRDHSSIDEYGVYFYCNNRLISKAYKGPEVGFRPPRIGKPHPSSSLSRVIVKLSGPVELMPWNSSKSEIDFKHKAFKEIDEHIEKILFVYASMSKSWSGEWPEKVFKYSSGIIIEEKLSDMSHQAKIHLVPVPRNNRKRKYADIIKNNNRIIAKAKPWVIGLYETIIAVHEISKLNLDQKNRICLLTLDSMLEIAFKEYLVNDSGTSYSATRLENLMKNRQDVQNEVKSTVALTQQNWKKIEYFYKIRGELVHKRATLTITDNDLAVFQELVKYVLKKLFGLNFKEE